MNNVTTAPKNREDDKFSSTGSMSAELKNKGQEAANKATGAASMVADKAKDVASSVAHKAEDLASSASHKADDAVSTIGQGMKSLAGTIREKAPHEGVLGAASAGVAGTLESSGRYLKEEGLSGAADDFANLIRRNPIPALLAGIGIGFLLARSLRS